MIEQELIASVLKKPETLADVYVRPEWFSSEAHGYIWRRILALQSNGERIDAVTVMDSLQVDDPDLASRVITIANESVGIASHAASYARKMRQTWRAAMESDIGVLLSSGEITGDEAVRRLVDLNEEQDRFEFSIIEAMNHAINDMQEAAQHGGGIRGITTGIAKLDEHLGGWHKSDLAIIGARPSHGKTALLLHHAQKCRVPAGLISAEQPAFQIAQRHIASMGKVSLSDIRAGKIGDKESSAILGTRGRLNETGYWIYDRSNPDIVDVERVARRWHHKHGIQILFVDYVQRIRGRGDKRHEQVGDVVRSLKTIARDLNIPVVALAQVSRAVDSRTGSRQPGMADLADSSEIEKEADQIITLNRPEVYDDSPQHQGVAYLSICKNRHGYTGTVTASWAGEFVSFGDMKTW